MGLKFDIQRGGSLMVKITVFKTVVVGSSPARLVSTSLPSRNVVLVFSNFLRGSVRSLIIYTTDVFLCRYFIVCR